MSTTEKEQLLVRQRNNFSYYSVIFERPYDGRKFIFYVQES